MPTALPDTGALARFYRLVPAVESLRRYSFAALRSDVVAGLTVATVAVPQGMAYALVAGVPVEHGLYTAIVMTAVGALFDSSRQLINGPTNAISIAVLSAVAVVPPEGRIQATVLLAFLVGSIQVAITLLRLGDLTRYISHSVILGFTLGAGSLLVLDQLRNLLGLSSMGDVHDPFLVRFWLTMTGGGPVHLATLAMGFGAIGLVLALRAFKSRVGWRLLPDLLLAVVAAAAACAWLGLDEQGVKVIGEIPASLPSFALPHLDTPFLRPLSTSALAIATLGLLEAIAMAKAIAAHTRQKLDINQQCLSEGLANLSGSFFQCIPGSGSLTRSAINQQAGGLTQWSGVISALAVAAIVLAFGPYAHFIPKSALAGILMVSAWKMVDWKALRYYARTSRFDRVVIAITALAAVAISIEFCVLIGVFMSFLLAVPRAGRMLLTEFIVSADGVIHERMEEDVVCGRILIFGLEGEMFFGAAASLEAHLETIEERIDAGTRVVVLRMKRLRSPDAVCMHLLDEHLQRIEARGVHIIMVGVRNDMFGGLKRSGIAARIGADNIFREQPVRHTSTQKGIHHAYELVDEPCETCPRRDPAVKAEPLGYSI
ncbi:MAG: SulP family inorganic anion transporter [Deltaproteobacteria bacterium]|nr:SulP family inorganic anion transporter [Deltaproteobacteria bacterium]